MSASSLAIACSSCSTIICLTVREMCYNVWKCFHFARMTNTYAPFVHSLGSIDLDVVLLEVFPKNWICQSSFTVTRGSQSKSRFMGTRQLRPSWTISTHECDKHTQPVPWIAIQRTLSAYAKIQKGMPTMQGYAQICGDMSKYESKSEICGEVPGYAETSGDMRGHARTPRICEDMRCEDMRRYAGICEDVQIRRDMRGFAGTQFNLVWMS